MGEHRGGHGTTHRFSAQGGEDLPRAAVPAHDLGTPAVPGAGCPHRLKNRGPQPGVEVIDCALDDGHVALAQVPLRAGRRPNDHPGDVGPVRGVPATAAGAHRAHRHGRKAARCGRRREQGRTGRGGALARQFAAGQVQAGRGGDTEDGGAGTGRRPCRLVTNPLPAARAEQQTTAPGRSSPRSCSAAADPTTSASESNAPTSWKCTSSGGSPCTAPSASASSRKTRAARSFPAGWRSLAPTCPSTSARCRGRSVTVGVVITARRHARPPRRAASVRSPRPGTLSEAMAPRTRSRSAPASSSAASSMSPATPAVASMKAAPGRSVTGAPRG